MASSIFNEGTPLTTRMFAMAAQENHDGEEYDLLQEGAERIRALEAQLREVAAVSLRVAKFISAPVYGDLTFTHDGWEYLHEDTWLSAAELQIDYLVGYARCRMIRKGEQTWNPRCEDHTDGKIGRFECIKCIAVHVALVAELSGIVEADAE